MNDQNHMHSETLILIILAILLIFFTTGVYGISVNSYPYCGTECVRPIVSGLEEKNTPQIEENWNVTFGGNSFDGSYSVIQSSDGGYALTGYTWAVGSSDFWLIKTNSDGEKEWAKNYFDSGNSYSYSIIEDEDGGFVMAGWFGNYGYGDFDARLVKTDSSGNIKWDRKFGSSGIDEGAYSVIKTPDGGFAIAGFKYLNETNSDFWLIKTDSNGHEEWNRTYGRDRSLNSTFGVEVAYSVINTSDKGYLLVGYTDDGLERDAWLIKTNSTGIEEWNFTYGGVGYDEAYSIVETEDGYVFAGGTTTYSSGGVDAWLVKTNSTGVEEWNSTYGGKGYDEAYSLVEAEEGFVIAGGTTSLGKGGIDGWLVKTDIKGAEKWNTTFGGVENDEVYSVIRERLSGNSTAYVLAGYSSSFGEAVWDWNAWLVKVNVTEKGENDTNGQLTPCVLYDTNDSGLIELDEAVAAVIDYFDRKIDLDTVVGVIVCYFSSNSPD